jgi:hypothetical protein
MAGRGEDLRAGDLYQPTMEAPDGDRFCADIAEVVHTHLNEEATMPAVEWWTPTHGLGRIGRE